MYRFLLTPRWWGINLFVVLAIPFCVFMGSWQLGRFEDRVESHRAAEEKPAAAKQKAAALDSLLPVDKATSGRLATVSGRYGDQLLVPGRELDGKRGYYVLTLLRTDGGKAVPVVRGWLAGEPGTATVPAPPAGEVSVTGALQASENTGTKGVHAQGGLPEGQLGMISAAALVNLVPYELHDAWLTLPEVPKDAVGMRPVPAAAPQGSGLDLKAFQNLGYTGEWFVFGGFVLFMWFRLFRREVEAAKDTELGLLPEEPAQAPGREQPENETAQRGQRVQVRERDADV
ncbi:SURF1 family protein [Streptomyces sp. A3M-1-3]|uniref:SURF1 family protein n=1 Tax=Streptomyces sp. A3M-1-3 TaxID=2962044 RepID=UPI0020B83DC7|nr:SURF1 family protein [Streptomyces sp. A3M-1-3]MCP3817904.1 SURF1 family protein [Streptomyces sp. A3M-1-3]